MVRDAGFCLRGWLRVAEIVGYFSGMTGEDMVRSMVWSN